MKRISSALALAALVFAAPASAQTISGKYIVTLTKLCQLTTTVNFASASGVGNYVNGLNSSGSSFKQSMLQATFSPTKGTVNVNGFDDGGDVVIYQLTGTINSTLGNALVETPNTGKIAYSNTATTFTIGGMALNALYGQIDRKGVAHYATFQGVFANESGQSCTEQGTISLQ